MKDHGDHWDEPARCGRCGQERSTHDDGECETVTRIYKKPAVKAETPPAHTPAPWELDQERNQIWKGDTLIAERGALSPENVAFIVRACNNFEKILNALEQVQIIVDSQGGMDRLGVAIAKVIEEAKQ